MPAKLGGTVEADRSRTDDPGPENPWGSDMAPTNAADGGGRTGPADGRADRSAALVGSAVPVLLLLPQLARWHFTDSVVFHGVLQAGAIVLATGMAVVFGWRYRRAMRPRLAAIAVAVSFAAAAVSYLSLPLGKIPASYPQSLLQYATYPLLLGVFVAALTPDRTIMRTVCALLVAYAAAIAIRIAVGLAMGQTPRDAAFHGWASRDAKILAFGAIAALTLAATAESPRVLTRLGRWHVRSTELGLLVAGLFVLAMLPCFARGVTVALLCALVTALAAWRLGRRVAAGLCAAALCASVAYPVLVWSGAVTPSSVGWISAVVPGKWEADSVAGRFTASRRVNMLRAFLSRFSAADALGTRAELHDYSYYHEQDVRSHVRTPHNYWAALLLTAGYVPVLCVLALWCYTIVCVSRSRSPVSRWLPAWLVFFAVQGLAGRGAWNGLEAAIFWCVVASALAPAGPPREPLHTESTPSGGANEEKLTHAGDSDT